MENQFIIHQLQAVAEAITQIESQNNNIKNAICVLLGYIKADNEFGNGFGNASEEIKQMLVELNITGSIRKRTNGLIELRTQAFGSIYGRTKAEIEQKLSQKLKEAQTQKLKQPQKNVVPTLSEFFENTYLPLKLQTVKTSQIRSIKSSYKTFINNAMDLKLNKFTTAELERFLLSIEKTRTRQVVRCFINNLLNYAKQLEIIKSNPCDNVSKVKHVKHNGKALSFTEQKEFFKMLYEADNISLNKKLYYTFVYLTGTRRSEAICLTTADVDFKNNILHIPGTKTETSDRDMPLYPLVKTLLLKIAPNNKNRFFTLEQAKATQTIKKITTEHHLHELRHTYGTIAICVQKLDPKTVALYMGHSNPTVTLNIYTHPEQLDKELFYDGSKPDEEKLILYKQQYSKILNTIAEFLNTVPNSYPN